MGEREVLDTQKIHVPQQTIEIDAEGLCGELGIEPRAQSPEGMSMIDLNVKLIVQLAIDGFDDGEGIY